MTEFMRPTVTTEEVNDTVARYIVEPLERGYGHTLGNSLRRVLLSSLDGAKATAIQIEGVQHEFTTAEGVIEDITDIVLNVKGLVFSALNDDVTEATAHVLAEGPCTVTGADLDVPTEFTLVNPEHVIATVADGGTLDMTIRIGVGRGPHGACPVCRGKRSGERKSEKSDEEDEKHKIGPREQLLANATLRSHGTASFPTHRQSRKPQATPL